MYEAFFNLKSKPFSLLPDPEFLFLSNRHAIGLSLLEYSLTGQAGFCVITGEIGSGKTTLVRAFLGRVGREFTVGLISNTHHSLKDIAAWGLAAFGQKAVGSHPSDTYQQLMAYLIAEYGAGRQCILIVDEAQNLSIEVLEELRLLSNINSGKDLLLQVVLVGQPELLEKLRRPELSQFAQRIAVSHHLTPLAFAETRRYIEHRVQVAGCDRPLFTEMAMGAIQYFSGGIPRLINSICDMAMVYAFADEIPVIGEDLVFRVVSDRQVSGIAPFAQALPVDDAAIRAEIMKLANLGAAANEAPATPDSAAPDTATAAPAAVIPATVAPAAVAPAAIVPATVAPAAVAPAAIVPATVAPATVTPAAVAPTEAEPIAAIPVAEIPASETVDTRAEPKKEPPQTLEPTKPAATVAREATRREPVRANPYFFREADEDEEILLTTEMNDSSPNAHNVMPSAPRAKSHVAKPANKEPYLGAPRTSDPAPNQPRRTDETPIAIVDPLPWPSVSDRGVGAPIPAKEHGTGTLPRRSWWRRSIGRNS